MHKKDWKKFGSNNKTIALNILFVLYNSKKIRHALMLKHNSTSENQVILLFISDNEKWRYLAVKRFSALCREKILKNNGGSHCLNCLYSFRTKNKLEDHENVCKNCHYCYIEMPKKDF